MTTRNRGTAEWPISLAGKIATSFASTNTPGRALPPAAGVDDFMKRATTNPERSSFARNAVARRYFVFRWTGPTTPTAKAQRRSADLHVGGFRQVQTAAEACLV